MAWIESRDDVAHLLVAGQGRILLSRSLARTDTRDFGYEGCSVEHLSWCGKHLIVVTRELMYVFLLCVDPELGKVDPQGDECLCVRNAWRIERDLLVWVDYDPGMLCTAVLPSLEARPPLPFRGAPASGNIQLRGDETCLRVTLPDHAGGGTIDTLALPTDRQRAECAPVEDLLDIVERRLFPAAGAPGDARFAIEAVAHPFVRGAPQRRRRWCWPPPPAWMPVYWHRYLTSKGRTSEAGQLVEVLDALAALLPESEPEHGWDPGWTAREGQIELAVRHVCRQSRVLAGVCRSGVLPPGWWCLLFDPAPKSTVAGSRADPSAFPPTLRGKFELLAQTEPERLPRGP